MIDLFGNRAVLFSTFITALAESLKLDRQKLFLDWLCVHSSQAIESYDLNDIQACLLDWFESLSEDDALREYHLVTREIRWWRDLEDETLTEMLDGLDADSSQVAGNYFCQPALS